MQEFVSTCLGVRVAPESPVNIKKKGDITAISETNSFLFNDPFGLPGNFFRNNLTGVY